jgi:hypothetical protein
MRCINAIVIRTFSAKFERHLRPFLFWRHFPGASVLVEAPIKSPFVMYALLSPRAGVPLNVMCGVGSKCLEAMPLLGALAVLSFDNFAEEATARAVITAGLAGPEGDDAGA